MQEQETVYEKYMVVGVADSVSLHQNKLYIYINEYKFKARFRAPLDWRKYGEALLKSVKCKLM